MILFQSLKLLYNKGDNSNVFDKIYKLMQYLRHNFYIIKKKKKFDLWGNYSNRFFGEKISDFY